jgi:hypothetical protein
MPWVELVPSRSVYPSGGATATSRVPMLPPAPGLLSTMNCCLKASDSFCATSRPTESDPPPGVNGITMRTGREG